MIRWGLKLGSLILILCIATITSFEAVAQDPQYSQFYAAPTFLNPAFTGMTLQDRIILNYRHQWPSIPGAFVSYNFSYDHYFDLAKSGAGFIATRDRAGSGGLSYTSFHGLYAYEFQIARHKYFRVGTNFGMYRRDVDFNKLTFGDQLVRGTPDASTVETWVGEPQTFLDFGFGGLYYSRQAWFGVAASHINQPNQSLLGSQAALPLKYSAHGGWRTKINKRSRGKQLSEHSIVAAFNYKAQADFDQFDIGFYYEPDPIVFGVWYRGIPIIKTYEPNYQNNDAIVFLFGIHVKDWKLGYSYDATISRLVSNTGGSHEISIIYEWANQRKKLERRSRPVPCAKF
jgi:type IX secretion system PorP/SprF family membrane protein